MKGSKKIVVLSMLLLATFAIGSFSNKSVKEVHAEDEWTVIDTKALPTYAQFMYDASDTYIFFKLSVNDYSSGPSAQYVGGTPNYNNNDYNFLSYIQLSQDNVTYIPFSTITNPSNINYFFNDGTFRFGLRRNAETVREDATYKYIKVLQGCEFPSYAYCSGGSSKTKYVQSETTIAELTKVKEYSAAAQSFYSEFVPKTPVTFKEIAPGWNNVNFGGNYRALILSFGVHGVDYLARDHQPNATNRATSEYDVGRKVTFNGLPIYKIYNHFGDTKIGYDHGFCYFYVNYPVEAIMSTSEYLIPTFHIEAGTEFMDSILPEVTLKLIGGVWTISSDTGFKIEDPLDIDDYRIVDLPHAFGTKSHPVAMNLPFEGAKLAFNINIGEIDKSEGANQALNFDGLYNCLIGIFPNAGAVLLIDRATNNEVVGEFYGFAFTANTDYMIEIEIICGETTSVKFAINHCLLISHTFNEDRSRTCDLWCVDTYGHMTMDYFKEINTYKPTLKFDGTSTYDFLVGDPLYNFVPMTNAFDLYDENVSSSDIEYIYEEGAVTDNHYNEGVWTLTIRFSKEGYETITKVITINVHGYTSAAKIYYGDEEPIIVPIGTKLVPPPNPNTYREGDYDYVFDGWYFEGRRWDFENDLVEGDMHLEARFKPTTPHFIVTVNYEGVERGQETFSLISGSSLPFVLFEIEGATFEVYNGNVKIASLVVTDDVTLTVKYSIAFTYYEAVEATCTTDGHVAYWYSPVYPNYYFADPNGREIIPDAITPKLNHHIIHLGYKDSTCTESGNYECYYCENCHNHYVDVQGKYIFNNWEIEKKPHVLTHHDEIAATCTEDGVVEHWTCANEPGVYYGDSGCTIVLDTIISRATGHDYRAPIYTWTPIAGGYECKASIYCSHCHDEISETQVATKTIVRESTCSKEGLVSYYVRFSDDRFNNQNKLVTLPLMDHTYVHVDEIKATSERDGVKEHYECSECHKCFLRSGDNYKEVQYVDLYYKYKSSSKGCGGDIKITSLLLFASAGSLSILLMLKRKERK